MNSGLTAFLVVLVIAYTAFFVWLFVVMIQYLRVGTKARRRYLLLTEQDAREVVTARVQTDPSVTYPSAGKPGVRYDR